MEKQIVHITLRYSFSFSELFDLTVQPINVKMKSAQEHTQNSSSFSNIYVFVLGGFFLFQTIKWHESALKREFHASKNIQIFQTRNLNAFTFWIIFVIFITGIPLGLVCVLAGCG